jgi:hypothetical protein
MSTPSLFLGVEPKSLVAFADRLELLRGAARAQVDPVTTVQANVTV